MVAVGRWFSMTTTAWRWHMSCRPERAKEARSREQVIEGREMRHAQLVLRLCGSSTFRAVKGVQDECNGGTTHLSLYLSPYGRRYDSRASSESRRSQLEYGKRPDRSSSAMR